MRRGEARASLAFRKRRWGAGLPSRSDLRWSQLKVGILVAVAATVLLVVFFAMSSEAGLFRPKIHLISYVDNAADLRSGAVVDLQGVRIGNVLKVHLARHPPDPRLPVRIDMEVEANHRQWLRTDSLVSLGTTTFLGQALVNIQKGTPSSPPAVNGTVLKAAVATGISQLMVSSHTVLQNANELETRLGNILDQIQNGQGSIGRLIYSDVLYNRFNRIAHNVDMLTHDISSGQGTVGQLITNKSLYDKLNHTLDSLDQLLAQVRTGHGTAAMLINDPRLYRHFDQVSLNLNRILKAVNSSQGTLGELVNNRQLARKISSSVNNLDSLLAGIHAGKGTLGQLANNPTLYHNANALTVSLRNLVQAIRKQPKKYLTIHLKIF